MQTQTLAGPMAGGAGVGAGADARVDGQPAPGSLEALRSYCAVIRTHACTPLLERVVACLRAQTWAPARILFVDSSRSEQVREQLLRLGDVVPYPEGAFNYSVAINVGMAAVQEPHALLISAHVCLDNPRLVEDTLRAAHTQGVDVAYWCFAYVGVNSQVVVGPGEFDGYNGLSNSCSYLPVRLVKERPFRPDVFSAEDQEWASWYFRTRHGKILRCEHVDVKYENPHLNERKIINEELAIAYFVYPRNRWPDKIAMRAGRAALAFVRGRRKRALMHWEIASGLFMMWFKAPRATSKYF